MSERQQFIETWEEEFNRTMTVLKSFPPDKLDVIPAPGFRKAREVIEVLVSCEKLIDEALNGQLTFQGPKLTSTLDAFIKTYEQMHRTTVPEVQKISEERYKKPIKFLVGPKRPGDVPLNKFFWFLLHDHIHHRGQLTVYLRIAGGKLPSVYGPTADEPWM